MTPHGSILSQRNGFRRIAAIKACNKRNVLINAVKRLCFGAQEQVKPISQLKNTVSRLSRTNDLLPQGDVKRINSLFGVYDCIFSEPSLIGDCFSPVTHSRNILCGRVRLHIETKKRKANSILRSGKKSLRWHFLKFEQSTTKIFTVFNLLCLLCSFSPSCKIVSFRHKLRVEVPGDLSALRCSPQNEGNARKQSLFLA